MENLQSNKFIYRFLVIGIAVIVLACFCLVKFEMRVKTVSVDGIPVVTEASGARVTVENIGRGKDTYRGKTLIQVSGFAYMQGQPTDSVSMHVVLLDESEGKAYQLPTAMKQLPSVTELAGDGVSYDNCGYNVAFYTNNKKLKTGQFRVMILYTLNGEDYLMVTDTYLE